MNYRQRAFLARILAGRAVLLKLLFLSFCIFLAAAPLSATEVFTDRPDYPPGDSVVIMGIEFQSYETVTVQVTHLEGLTPPTEDYDPWDVNADDFGDFETFWIVPEAALGETLLVTATGQSSVLEATTIFTDCN